MSIHLTPSLQRLSFGWILALGLGLGTPGEILAQRPSGAGDVPSIGEDLESDNATPREAGVRQQTELEERFSDPRAMAAMRNDFPQLYTNAVVLRTNDQRALEAMIAGQAAPNRDLLEAHAKYLLSQLSRSQNIGALSDPRASARNVMVYDEFGANLRSPLESSRNPSLRTTYTQVLASLADDVLKSHLYPRTMYMVALSRSGDAAALPVFTRVLRDRDQPLTLKILAAIGLNELARGGAQDLPPQQAREAALALTTFLTQEPDTFWPAQYRALHALGALRQSASDPLNPDADLAAVVLSFLANPDAEPAVRAWAGWAMGMLRPSSRINQFNFELIAQHVGQAALSLGSEIVQIQAENPERAVRLTDLLYQLYLGLIGTSEIRDAGLLKTDHPSLAAQRATVQQIADRVRDVLAAAIELTRDAAPQQRPQYRQALSGRLDTLRSTLSNTRPTSLVLYPGGPQFPIADAGGTGTQARGESASSAVR